MLQRIKNGIFVWKVEDHWDLHVRTEFYGTYHLELGGKTHPKMGWVDLCEEVTLWQHKMPLLPIILCTEEPSWDDTPQFDPLYPIYYQNTPTTTTKPRTEDLSFLDAQI